MHTARILIGLLAAMLLIPACGSGKVQGMLHPEEGMPAGLAGEGNGPGYGTKAGILVGAERTSCYLPLLRGRRVGVVANHTSVIRRECLTGRQSRQESLSLAADRGSLPQRDLPEALLDPLPGTADSNLYVHLVDMLLDSGIGLQKVFSPEHGFRGQAEAGAKVGSQIDRKTGLPLVSLYGNHKKPSREDLQDLDILLFDLQDVGLRFYTYISTLHYVMEACAEAGIPVIVLDRPNPHAAYTDGPVLDAACCRSFVGMHPVPVVYGMTIGEYARMIQGEHWLKGGVECVLTVIPMEGCHRRSEYVFPVAPSPNLRSMKAVYAYPSLCFFEGTPVSLGRGTWHPFECFGFPGSPVGDYVFTPEPIKGLSENPPCKGMECRGFRVADSVTAQLPRQIHWGYLLDMYEAYPEKEAFFTSFFPKLAGTDRLSEDIRKGLDEEGLRASWQKDLSDFEEIRQKYLLYE